MSTMMRKEVSTKAVVGSEKNVSIRKSERCACAVLVFGC